MVHVHVLVLRATADRNVPIAGICFGHQIIAQAFGGTVRKFDGGWTCGLQSYDFEGFDQPVRLIAWHQDQVIEPPAGARIIASSATCRYAGMRLGETILTVQAHPEFTAAYIRELAAVRSAVVGAANAEAAAASLDTAGPDDFAPWLLSFLGATGKA